MLEPLAMEAKSPSLSSFVCLRICAEGLVLTVTGLGSGIRGGRMALRVCTSRVMTTMPFSA
ncbi:hypothetical protein D3C77_721240 [compost metagenome]